MVAIREINDAIDAFAEEIIAREGGGVQTDPLGLQSPEQYTARLKLKFRDGYIELIHMVQTGYQHLLAEMELLNENIKEFQISDKILAQLQDKEKIQERMSKGEGIQELVGFTDEQMIRFYRAAVHIFNDQRYNAAMEAFCFLTYLNPLNPSFWEAMGVSLERDHRADEAFQIYVVGLSLNVTSLDLWKKAFSCCSRTKNEAEKEFLINGAKKVIEQMEKKHIEPDFCRDLNQLLIQFSK